MHANSRSIVTNQHGVHQDLSRRVDRALTHPLRKPVAEHTRRAFDEARAWLSAQERALILDAGCGTGVSTRRLACAYPDHAVIGIDRSADRLARQHGTLPDNACLVRADLVDFWRLVLAAGWQPARHYLLYPNPYPKSGHLKMRWQGHPVFPVIQALGGRLELRSNWRLYLEEFAEATRLASDVVPDVVEHDPAGDYLTPFERKYHESGQRLWKLIVDLPYRPGLVPT
ncbi:tRNA G46 methylase TrmB [Modicisalibacter ilicicola DSM 19980]|uniref:tRNA (guanine(46)-N(7))-methyltransferase n=1 Tax=Modicisalibacter ilicicola DSM 19980 TaxID=1121942 RepID=A0A1M5B4V2_9GAMM|nr:methyltransferase domain-containing protein [Halomonas ilicicola]SHF37357.1 tRNA G46 methylase TrmB [Halomonas ilicicola DSM 19980]